MRNMINMMSTTFQNLVYTGPVARSVALLALASTVACASMSKSAGLDSSAPDSITVKTGVSGEQAQSQLQQAATRGGFTVTASSPGLVTVGPVSIKEDYRVRMMFYVAVVGDSATVRGTLTDPMRDLKDYPIRGNTGGRAAWGWREMSRLADALKTNATSTRTP